MWKKYQICPQDGPVAPNKADLMHQKLTEFGIMAQLGVQKVSDCEVKGILYI